MIQQMLSNDILDCVVTPDNATVALRRRLGLSEDEDVRIAYVPGPGDVVGTFGHWLEGRHDPRVSVIAYSTMFYSLMEKLNATALVVTQVDNATDHVHPRCRFVHVRPQARSGRFRYALGRIIDAFHLARIINAYRPHSVIVSTDAPALLLLLMPRSVHVVLSAHNTFWPKGKRRRDIISRVKNYFLTVCLRRLSSAVCTSPECRDQILALNSSAKALHVELPQFHAPVSPTSPCSGNARRLLFLGRLERNKGVFDLLTAFEGLSARFPDASLTYAGDGTAAAELEKAVAISPCRDRIRLVGRLQANAVQAALCDADLLVCPTRSSFPEGLALVVVEAAAYGVPSIVSSVVPAQDLFSGGCAIFPVDEVCELQKHCEAIMADHAKLRSLRRAVIADLDRFTDRRRSWGSALCQALLASG